MQSGSTGAGAISLIRIDYVFKEIEKNYRQWLPLVLDNVSVRILNVQIYLQIIHL
jgi:hypothetical protein